MSSSIEQVARLLYEIPFLQKNPGVSLDEVARTFGITPAQVRGDVGVAVFCGLPGGYPGDLIDVDLDLADDEGCLYLTSPAGLDRPLRLTTMEAASLQLALTAVRTLVPESTARQIDALMAKIAVPAAGAAEVRLAAGDADVREAIEAAISSAARVALVYDGRARGTTTTPVVDPVAVYVADGVVYLSAYSITNDGWRTYRLDRITQAAPTGDTAVSHGTPPDPGAWADRLAGATTVRLEVRRSAAWIGEFYPTRGVEPTRRGYAITMGVAEPAWLVHLLLSLGDEVIAVDPPGLAALARDRARDALAAYDRLTGDL